jgi:SAM-dependent methyltransferase
MNVDEYRTMRDVEDYFWWYVGFRRIYGALLDRYCRQAAAGRVLDAGCGTGSFLVFLEERYHPRRLTGVDFIQEALDFCAGRGFEDLVRASVVELPFEDRSFDLVVSLDVLCHRSVPVELVPLREFRRVLEPGGYLLLNLPAFQFIYSEHDMAVHTSRRYRRQEVEAMLRASGFRPLVTTYANFFTFPAVAGVRLAQKASRAFAGSGAGPGEDEHKSDLNPLPDVANRALTAVLGAEAHLVTRFRLPFGSSVTALAQAVSG